MIDFQIFNAEFNVTYRELNVMWWQRTHVTISSAEKAGAQAGSARSRNCKEIMVSQNLYSYCKSMSSIICCAGQDEALVASWGNALLGLRRCKERIAAEKAVISCCLLLHKRQGWSR